MIRDGKHRQSSLEPDYDWTVPDYEEENRIFVSGNRQSSLEPAADEKSEMPKGAGVFFTSPLRKDEAVRRSGEVFGGTDRALLFCLEQYPLHKNTAPVNSNIAVLYELQGDGNTAEIYYRKALDIMERRNITFARIYLNYSDLLLQRGSLQSAENILKIVEKKTNDEYFKMECSKLRDLLDSEMHLTKEKEELQRKLISVLSQAVIKKAEKAKKEYCSQADKWSAEGNSIKAAGARWLLSFCFERDDTYASPAWCSQAIFGSEAEAIRFCLEVYPVMSKFAFFNSNIAMLYEIAEDTENARLYHQKALEILKRGNPYDLYRDNVLFNCAWFLTEQRDFDGAENCLKMAEESGNKRGDCSRLRRKIEMKRFWA